MLALCLCLGLASGPSAFAQSVEVTPVAGYRMGGTLTTGLDEFDAPHYDISVADAAAFGVLVDFAVAEDGEIEFLYARQPSELRTDALFVGAPIFDLMLETYQLGGVYLFGDEKARLRPFLAVGLGLTRLLPGPDDLEDETRFSASIAGGVKAYLGHHFGVRAEVRYFGTVLDSETDPFCGGRGGTCFARIEGSTVSQTEIRGGLLFRF